MKKGCGKQREKIKQSQKSNNLKKKKVTIKKKKIP